MIILKLVELLVKYSIYQTYKFRINRSNTSPLIGGVSLDITKNKEIEEEKAAKAAAAAPAAKGGAKAPAAAAKAPAKK